MSMRILSVTLLLLSVCLCVQSANNRRHPTRGLVPLCCTEVSSADISTRVVGLYRIQKANGPCVKAIIFTLNNGKACVDPEAEWAQRFIAKDKKE